MIISPLVMTFECGFEYDQTFLWNTLGLCLYQHSLVTLKIRTHFILISETIEKLIAKHMNDFWMLKMYKGMKGKFIEGPTE